MSLIVVDMQDMFLKCIANEERRERVINRSVHEIEKARAAGRPIIILNYSDHGPSHDAISEAIFGYDDIHFLWKDSDDGWFALEKLFKSENNRFGQRHYVIGINCKYCVGDTVHSMVKAGHEPILIWGAIEDAWADRQAQKTYIKNCNLRCIWK